MHYPVLILMLLATAMAVAVPALADEPASIDAPKVLTDGYVDTSSAKAIADHFFKDRPGVSEEQKMLDFYHWFRRVVYPFRNMGPDRRHVTKAINTAGCSLCGSQAGLVLAILREAGYDCRAVNGSGGPEWGHTFWEVKYDDGWHLFDAMSAFYVRVRTDDGKPGHIASADELEADPTLISKAQAEGRCGPEFLYSMRNHEITLEEREQFRAETEGKDVPWSLLVTKPGSLLDFWVAVAENKKISAGKVNNVNGGHDTPGVLDVTLKANETYVRMWQGQGKWLIAPSFPKYPPANMSAGGNEAFDAINFKYYEPYRREKPNPFNEAIYRAYGNGWLEWKPAGAAGLRQGIDQIKSIAVADDGTLSAEGKGASLLIPVKSPYGVVEATLDLIVEQGEGAETAVSLLVGTRDKANKASFRKAEKVLSKTGKSSGRVSAVHSLALARPSAYDFAWRIELSGDAKVKVARVHTLFQCSPMALPGLLPGENKVTVSADKFNLPAGQALKVCYHWAEGAGWKTEKNHIQHVSEFPATYTVKVDDSTGKLPRMEKLVIAIEEQPAGK